MDTIDKKNVWNSFIKDFYENKEGKESDLKEGEEKYIPIFSNKNMFWNTEYINIKRNSLINTIKPSTNFLSNIKSNRRYSTEINNLEIKQFERPNLIFQLTMIFAEF